MMEVLKIEIEDEFLNRKIKKAQDKAEELLKNFPSEKKEILSQIFEQGIYFRVAKHLNLSEETEKCLKVADELYEKIIFLGMEEKEVAEMSRKVVNIFTE